MLESYAYRAKAAAIALAASMAMSAAIACLTHSGRADAADLCVPATHTVDVGKCDATCGGGFQTVKTDDGCGHEGTYVQSCNTQRCCEPKWQETKCDQENGLKTIFDANQCPGSKTREVACRWTAVEWSKCTPYQCGGKTTCGGTPECKSTWVVWGDKDACQFWKSTGKNPDDGSSTAGICYGFH